MVTANELLAQLDGAEERVCVIDLVTRKINIPSSITTLGVEHDDDVKRLHFRMPKMYGDVDMSTFNIRINYMNAANEGDIYVVTDKNVEDDIITFSWRVGPHALAAKGDVNFIACFKGVDPTDTDNLRELNTTVATLPVLEGLEVDAAPLTGKLQDILEQLQTLTVDKVNEVKAEGKSQLEKLQAKSEEEQENIKGTADYIRSTFGDDYETTVKMTRTRANAIVQTVEGDTISIDDASDDPLRGLRVFGKSTQVSTTGIQLWNNTFVGPATMAGVTLSYKDGMYTLNGTCTTSSNFRVGVISLAAGTYTLSANNPKNNGKDLPNIQVYSPTTLKSLPCKDNVNNAVATLDLTEGTDYELRIRIEAGITYSGYTLIPVLNSGSTPLAWEPYSGGHQSPSPEWPQEIASVENPTLRILGTNVFDLETMSGQYAAIDEDSFGAPDYRSAANIPVTPGVAYTIRAFIKANTAAPNGLALSVQNGYEVGYSSTSAPEHIVLVAGVTTEWLEVNLAFTAVSDWISISSIGTIRKDFMMSIGSTGQDYESYKVQTLTLNRTLPGIPVNTDGNYTDQNGQQWICDEIDFERGVYVQRIRQRALTDRDIWTKGGTVVNGMHRYFITADGMLPAYNGPGYCSHYIRSEVSTERITSDCVRFGDGNIAVLFYSSTIVSVDDWIEYVTEKYASDEPIVLYYPLATPIETPLTEAELAAYAALHSNYPNTTIVNDQGAYMEMKYNADTATYFTRSRASAEQVQAAVNAYLDEHPASAAKASIINGVLKIT